MAEKNANIRINLDNRQAVDGLKRMNKSVKDTGKEVKSATERLGEMEDRLHDMKTGTKEFRKLEKEAAKLQRRVDNVNNRVGALSSSSFQLEGATQVVGGMVSAYSGLQGALALTGVENEKLMETLVKLQGVQMVSQSIQEVGLMFRKDSVAAIFLQTKAQKIKAAVTSANTRINRIAASVTAAFTGKTNAQTAATSAQTTATKAATLGTRALSTAMKAIPIIGLIAGITALVGWMVSWGDEAETAEEKQKRLNEEAKALNKILNQQAEATKRVLDQRKELRGVQQSQEELEINRQIIKAKDRIADLNREEGDNTEEIIQATKTLQNLEVELIKEKRDFKIEEFQLDEKRRKERIKEINKEFQVLGKTEEDIKQRAKLIQERDNLIAKNQTQIEEELNELRLDFSNKILQKRLDNENKIADLRKKLNEEAEEEEETNKNGISLPIKKIEQDYKDLPKTLEKNVTSPWLKAMSEMYRKIHEKQKRQEELNRELTARTLENIFKISDGIQSAIDQDFDSINHNLRLVSENILGPGGLMQKMKDEGKSFAEVFKENMGEIVSEIGLMTTQVLSKMNDSFVEDEEKKLDKLTEKQQSQLDKQLSERQISQEQYDDRKAEMEQTAQMRRREIAREEFRREKALALVDAGILTSKSIMQAIAQFGPPPSPAGIAGIAAASSIGAIQAGLIASQTFQAADGGIVPGEGLGSEDSVPSMLAPGEVVINSRSAKAFMPLLSMMNEAGGGMQLAPDIESPVSERPMVYDKNKKNQPTEAYVVFDKMDYMNKQVNRTIKNNSF